MNGLVSHTVTSTLWACVVRLERTEKDNGSVPNGIGEGHAVAKGSARADRGIEPFGCRDDPAEVTEATDGGELGRLGGARQRHHVAGGVGIGEVEVLSLI